MSPGSDGVVVAAPAWHELMQAALDQLQRAAAAWFLSGTSAATPPPSMPPGVRLTGG